MNIKRPCLLMAVVFALGELIASNRTGLGLKALLAGAFALYLLAGLWLHVRAEAGRSVRFLQLVCIGNLSRGAVALLLVLCMAGAARYVLAARSLEAQAQRIASFGDMRVKLTGLVERCELPPEQSAAKSAADAGETAYTGAAGTSAVPAEKKEVRTLLTLGNARLSSAYGSVEALPAGASEKLRARYEQPVGRVQVYLDGTVELYPGEEVVCEGVMLQEKPPRNEGMFDFALYYRSLGVSGRMFADTAECFGGSVQPFARELQAAKQKLTALLYRICEPADAALYQAMLLGDKRGLDEEILSLYQDSGISHIIAISGLHLSIIGMGLYTLLRKLGLRDAGSGAISSLLVISYGILTGASGSAMRAVIMLLCRFLAKAVGRSYDMLSGIGLAALLLLCSRPYLLFASGFQLSFAAVLSLSFASVLWRPKQPLVSALYSSLMLQLGTLPVVLYHFFQFPLYGVFLNLLVLPLMAYVLYAGIAAVTLYAASERLAWLALGGGHYILQFYTWLCTLANRLPYAQLMPGQPGEWQIACYYGILAGLYCLLRLRRRNMPRFGYCLLLCAGISAALFCMAPRRRAPLEITMLDVGQGDGMVLRFGRQVLTVDLGSSSDKKLGENAVEPYLKSQGIRRIHAALVSHADGDHTSGILYLLEESCIQVEQLILPEPAAEDVRYDALRQAAEKRGTTVHYLGAGDALHCGTLALECLYPANDPVYMEDPNRHSAAVLLRFEAFEMLFTGDMDVSCEAELLKEAALRGAEAVPHGIDVLKLGHHGSRTSTSEELLAYFQPEYALLSYGNGNSYGHPNAEVLERLERYGVETLKTGELGQIRLHIDGTQLELETFLPYLSGSIN